MRDVSRRGTTATRHRRSRRAIGDAQPQDQVSDDTGGRGSAPWAWPALARFLNCSDGGPRGQRRGHKQRSGRLRMVIDE